MLAIDTSALVKRYVDEPGTARVVGLMRGEQGWSASALALVETHVTLCHLGFDAHVREACVARLLADWERFVVVPIDEQCLARATEIGCELRVRTLDAIHLAAAERLPGPASFLTFDARQAEAAAALGLTEPA